MDNLVSVLTQLISADKVGGWTRAGVTSVIVTAIDKWPGLSNYLDPTAQAALAVVVSTVVVGFWSQLAKSDAAKIKLAAGVPQVEKITVGVGASPAVAALVRDDSQPKVVSK